MTPAVGAAAIGIEIGGTKLQAALVGADGAVVLRRAGRVDPATGAQGILAMLERHLADLVRSAASAGVDVRGAGVGFGGPVDRTTGVVARSFHVGGWADFPLGSWVAERIRGLGDAIPCVVENDSNAAALAEATVGAGRGSRVVFYTNSGSGIGAGLAIEGRLYRGRRGGEMEFGHLRLDAGGPILEEAASGWALDRRVRAEVERDRGGLLARLATEAGVAPTARLLPAALAIGDGAAERILNAAAEPYARGLAHVVQLLNPDVIVLGGGVAAIGEPWRARVATYLEPLLMEVFRPAPPVRLAALGDDVVPVGAALTALADCSGTNSRG